MRITFVTACLECGGAERALISLVTGLRRAGHTISVITLSGKATDFYSLPHDVEREALDLIPAVRSRNIVVRLKAGYQRLKALRRAIPAIRPDVIISSLQHVNVMTLIALTGKSIPVVVVEQNDSSLSCGEFWNFLRRVTYPRAAMVVSVSEGVNNSFEWLPQAKRTVINNPLTPEHACVPECPASLEISPDLKYLIGMGRLTYLKGFDLLLKAYAGLADKFPDWNLIIIGDGELRSELEKERDRLGLAQRVLLTGQIAHPFSLLRRSDLFALPSRSEGFPNVLIEAMACSLPVVAADCPSGPKEIVRHGENGLLFTAGDVTALREGLSQLMGNDQERLRLASKTDDIEKRFGVDKITAAWEKLLHTVGTEKGGSSARDS